MKRPLVLAFLLVVVVVLASACKPNPAECLEKGDEKACQALCDTGKPELMSTCYEMRAREAAACADGKGDCTKACANWSNAQAGGDQIKNFYVAKLGSEAKVAQLNARCLPAKK